MNRRSFFARLAAVVALPFVGVVKPKESAALSFLRKNGGVFSVTLPATLCGYPIVYTDKKPDWHLIEMWRDGPTCNVVITRADRQCKTPLGEL